MCFFKDVKQRLFKIKSAKKTKRTVAMLVVLAVAFGAAVPQLSAGGAYSAADSSDIRVLAIAADNSSYSYCTGEIQSRVKSAAGITVPTSSIDIMTSAQANCLKSDFIGSYDYIVVIANKTFKHTGDQVTYGGWTNPRMLMSKTSGYETSVLSGNDISAALKEKIIDFFNAGYPVEFMYGTNMGSAVSGNSNETNAAGLYSQLNGSYRVVNGSHSTDADTRLKNITSGKLKLLMGSVPTDNATTGYVNASTDKSKLLTYKFTINDGASNASSKKYTARYYIDMNNDGVYDEDTEVISYLGITLASNEKKTVELDSLAAGVEYKLTVNATEYVGQIGWKLVITDNSSAARHITENGSCTLQLIEGQEKEHLRVLQLTAIANRNDNISRYTENNVYLPTKAEMEWFAANESKFTSSNIRTYLSNNIKGGELFNVDINSSTKIWGTNLGSAKQTNILKNMLDFYKAFSGSLDGNTYVQNYDVDVTRIYVNDLPATAGADDWNIMYQYLTDNYDMIVLGFADCYDDITSTQECAAIEAFIAEGKAVLFTHDTSSFVNNANTSQNAKWGYNINKYFRNILGMDRYGFTLSETERTVAGKDFNNTGYLQGYNDITLKSGSSNSVGNTTTTSAVRLNEGPVTSYPYQIGSNITIQSTHTQYYQLDLEADDLTVWYALDKNAYTGSSYADGRNNYYIYNKGNITYSGVGHSAGLTTDEIKLFTNTIISAYRAGDSSVSIEVTDWDASAGSSSSGSSLYELVTIPVDYIKKAMGGAYGERIVTNNSKQYRRVSFRITDQTVASNKTLSLDFYSVSSASDMSASARLDYYAGSVYRQSDGKVVMKNGSSVSGQRLESGVEYYIYVPLKAFDAKQIFRGDIKASLKPNGQTGSITMSDSVFVSFNNRLQFDLQ